MWKCNHLDDNNNLFYFVKYKNLKINLNLIVLLKYLLCIFSSNSSVFNFKVSYRPFFIPLY